MTASSPEFGFFAGALLSAGGLGAIIGLERQWHQGVAGLRTNSLVGLAASAFVCLPSVLAEDGTGPAHMANFIVTGIGFLGGGVILRDGANVKGMNTAATLWATGAVGALCGAGLPLHGLALTAGVLTVNLAMRPVVALLNRVIDYYGAGTPSPYLIKVVCATEHRERIRALLVSRLDTTDFVRRGIDAADGTDASGDTTFILDITSYGGHDKPVERFVSALWADPSVKSAKWSMASPDSDPKMHPGS